MKYTITITLLTIQIISYGQYNYGLDLCNQDFRLTGKMNITDTTESVIIGNNSGINNTGERNIFIGENSGINNQSGHSNLFLGYQSGFGNTIGSNNTYLGFRAGQNSSNTSNTMIGGWSGVNHQDGGNNVFVGSFSGSNTNIGSDNVFIGTSTGELCDTCSANVFIGHNVGSTSDTSNKLFIDNSNTQNPLIYGEFDSDKIQINGSISIRDALQLIPQTAPVGSCTTNGELVYGNDDELYLCKAGMWSQIQTN